MITIPSASPSACVGRSPNPKPKDISLVARFTVTAAQIVLGAALVSNAAAQAVTNINHSFFVVPQSAPGGPTAVAANATHIYWAYTAFYGSIGRANRDGSAVNDTFINFESDEQPQGIAIDNNYIYWSSYQRGAIGRANLDGSGVNRNFITGLAYGTSGLAVNGTHIFWSNAEGGQIGRANLNGTGVNPTFLPSTRGWGVAVDANYIYWVNGPSGFGTIGRATLAGSDPNQSFITGCDNPKGVAVDAGHIYWSNIRNVANSTDGTIGRAKLDGTEADQSIVTGIYQPFGVVSSQGQIFWSAFYGYTVGRADLFSRIPEFTVFGMTERTQLVSSAASSLIKLERPSVTPQLLNYDNNTTYSISLIKAGTLVLDQANDPDFLYSQYFDGRTDIASMEIMAETLIIRSPLLLKQTAVKIYARQLRFENTGSINTRGDQTFPNQVINAGIDNVPFATSGSDGLSAGTIDVFVAGYTDATGNNNPKFVLTGNNGQAAGRGRHGTDGSFVDYLTGELIFELDCGIFGRDEATYTPPGEYGVIYWRREDGTAVWGVNTFPSDGRPASPAGTPGRGGNGATLTTSVLSPIPNGTCVFGAGQAGAPGTPTLTTNQTTLTAHTSTTICEGGYAGIPNYAVKIRQWSSDTCTANMGEIARRTSSAGSSFPVPTANAGAPGSVSRSESRYRWLNPQLLRKIIADSKDDYLQNRLATAEARLQDYNQLLELARADTSEWAALPQMTRFELRQMQDEMRVLLQQIANHQDYFGNPNGWVPMLSFEVAATLFNQEIDRSLDIIYLSQWIATKQDSAAVTLDALSTARGKLRAEIETAKNDYDTANTTLAGLQGQLQALHSREADLIIELQAADNALHAQAVQESRPPDWEIGVRFGLKVAATTCKMVPVYQPALGEMGNALSAGSELHPESMSYEQLITFGLGVTSTNLSAVATTLGQEKEGVNTNNLSSTAARITTLQNLSTGGAALSEGIQDMSGFLKRTEAPSTEISAALDKLQKSNPRYTNVVSNIQVLLEEKRLVVDQLLAAINGVASSSDLITRNILSLDGLDVAIGANANLIDARVNAYLKDMERRAFDRLLKYHYFMAKAYEYRLVRPYNGQLDLSGLYNQIQALAGAGTNASSKGALTDGQRAALHSVFKDVIADTTEQIYTEYQNNPSTEGSSFSFDLTARELASLNRGEAITLNLVNRGYFPVEEENIRIADIRVLGPAPGGITTTGTYGSPAFVDVCIEHSGLSGVKLDGQVFQFRHYNRSTRNAITWRSRYEPVANILSPGPLIAANGSLLRSLLPGLATADVLLYSRPSAWADLKVWRAGINGSTAFGLGSTNAPIKLTRVTLQVLYDRTPRAGSPMRKNLDVLAARPVDGTGGFLEDDLMAIDFNVSAPDPNGRQNAQGRFLRIYNAGLPATVTVTTQQRYGDLGFFRWMENGVPIGSSPTITVSTTADHRLVAQYVSLGPIQLGITRTGGGATLSWQGRFGVRLQKRACLSSSCPWVDVPGTEGASTYVIPAPASGQVYYRLVE